LKIGLNRTTGGILMLYLSSFVLSLGQGMILPALPFLVSELGISVAAAAQVITAYALGRFLALVPAGVLVDRIGARAAVIATPILIAAAILAVAAAPTYPALLAAMLIAGGAEGIWNLSREIAGVGMVRPDQRGRLMSGFMGSSAAGMALGSAVGGLLLEIASFRAVLLLYGLLSLGVGALSVFGRESVPARAERAARSFGDGFRWRSMLNVPKLIEEIEPGLRRTFMVLVVATFVMTMYRMFVQAMVPLYAGSYLHFSPSQVGFLFSIMGAVLFAMIIPAGLIIDKLGRKWATVPSTALPALAFVLMPFCDTFAQLAALFVLLGIANGTSLGSIAASTYDVLPAASRGRLQALRRTLAEIGGISGPLLGGMVAGASNPGVPFLVVAPILLLSALWIAFGAKETLVKVPRHTP